MRKRVLSLLFACSGSAIFAGNPKITNYLVRCNEMLVEVVMEDLFNPPVSSRVYVYPNIAAYEVLALANPQLKSLSGQIKHMPQLQMEKENINFSIAAEFAYTTVAKKLVFTENMVTAFEKDEINLWKQKNIDSAIIYRSIAFGKKAAAQLIAWIVKDNYTQVRTMERYVLQETQGAWKPTAPQYAPGLEPNWMYMRPLIMDSAAQFKSIPGTPYSENKTSQFYKEAYDVYKNSIKLDTAKRTVALFWDCNPNISYSKGHLTYFVHKISPGGHWIKIAGQACKNLNFDEYKTSETYALLTIGLYDAFLSCWTEKYRSHAIRPETYIQRMIDVNWLPYIQTPPFPEYTSGHSVVSSTSSKILTKLIPQPYAFTDSSEMYIGIPPRTFSSFTTAAEEACISRYHGGIHFMPSIVNGAKQGNEIGNYVLEKISTRK